MLKAFILICLCFLPVFAGAQGLDSGYLYTKISSVGYHRLGVAASSRPQLHRNRVPRLVYPSPAYDHFIVNSTEPVIRVRVVDAAGNTCFDYQPQQAFNTLSVNVKQYTPGLYLVHVYHHHIVTSQTLLKQ